MTTPVDTANPATMQNSMLGLAQEIAGANMHDLAEVSQPATLMRNNRYSMITLNRALLSSLYMEHGLVQVIIDAPVDEAIRGGVDVTCDELDADDIKTLQEFIDTEGVLQTLGTAQKWARLYGGGGVIVNAGQKFDKPFEIERMRQGGPLAFYDTDRWELSADVQGNVLDQTTDHLPDKPYNYYGHVMHKSNVLPLQGKRAPSVYRGYFGGWGMSELERLVRDFNQYLKHTDVVFELLDEAKVDCYAIEGLSANIASAEGQRLTAQRISLANRIKNFQNALIYDKNDGYEQKQITFSGLAEMLNEIRKGIACDAHMPLTKLFGISAAGFSSGEDDIESWNATVESDVRAKMRGAVITVLKICCMHLFGVVPDTLNFKWKPLRVLGYKDEADLKTQALNRVTSAVEHGFMTSETGAEQLNADKVFPLELNPSETVDLETIKEIGAEDKTPDVAPGAGVTVL